MGAVGANRASGATGYFLKVAGFVLSKGIARREECYFEAFERRDLDAFAELFHDDYVEEYPQSGERIRGKQNARAVNENYPGLPSVINAATT